MKILSLVSLIFGRFHQAVEVLKHTESGAAKRQKGRHKQGRRHGVDCGGHVPLTLPKFLYFYHFFVLFWQKLQ